MFSNDSSVGSYQTNDETKRKFAKASKEFNLQNQEFLNAFGDYLDKIYAEEIIKEKPKIYKSYQL